MSNLFSTEDEYLQLYINTKASWLAGGINCQDITRDIDLLLHLVYSYGIIFVNTDSGSGLLSNGHKPLLVSVLIYQQSMQHLTHLMLRPNTP